jgi:hypothetical protein
MRKGKEKCAKVAERYICVRGSGSPRGRRSVSRLRSTERLMHGTAWVLRYRHAASYTRPGQFPPQISCYCWIGVRASARVQRFEKRGGFFFSVALRCVAFVRCIAGAWPGPGAPPSGDWVVRPSLCVEPSPLWRRRRSWWSVRQSLWNPIFATRATPFLPTRRRLIGRSLCGSGSGLHGW